MRSLLTPFQEVVRGVQRAMDELKGGMDPIALGEVEAILQAIERDTLLPNLITLLALCAGLTAIRVAVEGRLELALAAIVFAALLDSIDGRIARMLKGTSRFGAELDSLADFVNFGVAPGLMVELTQGMMGPLPVWRQRGRSRMFAADEFYPSRTRFKARSGCEVGYGSYAAAGSRDARFSGLPPPPHPVQGAVAAAQAGQGGGDGGPCGEDGNDDRLVDHHEGD